MQVLRLHGSQAASVLDVATRAIQETEGAPYTAAQVEAWLSGLSEERFRQRLEETVAFGAFEGEQLIGFGTLSEETRVLEYLYVAPEHWARGIGRRIVEEIEKHARSTGLPEVRVDASALASPLLERLGYVPVSEYDKEVRGAVFRNTWLAKRLT